MSATTRTAGAPDVRAVLDLAAAVRGHDGHSGAALEKAVRDGLVRVAESQGAVVGYAVLEHPLPHHVRLSWMGVHRDHRRFRGPRAQAGAADPAVTGRQPHSRAATSLAQPQDTVTPAPMTRTSGWAGRGDFAMG